MRTLMSNILFTIYLVYLLTSSFPTLTWCIYQDISSFGQQTRQNEISGVSDLSDLNYLNAIKERAGMNHENDKKTPERVNTENLNINCIISERINAGKGCPIVKTRYFTYQNLYIDAFPEIDVPPPRSA